MSDLNQCNFIGRLGADPEIKYLPNGDAVANFSIAVSEKYKDKNGEQRENTEWIRVAAFRKLAEVMGQYLKKGSRIFISGKMKTRKWQDQNGQDRYTTEIIADQMQMLDSRDDGNRGQNDHGRNDHHDYRDSSANRNGNRNGPGSRPPARQPDDFDDSDIPF